MSCDEEALTEYLDGELPSERRAALASHLAACPDCRAALERLRSASAAFREHAGVKAPPGLAEEALKRPVRETKGREFRWAPAAVLALMLCALIPAGNYLRWQFVGIRNQVMGMISGAASSVGGPIGSEATLMPPSGVGAVVGALAAAAVLIIYLLWRRRRKQGNLRI